MMKKLNSFLLKLEVFLPRLDRILAVVLAIILIYSIIYITKAAALDAVKSYVCAKNNEAEEICIFIGSENCSFNDYCEKYSIPQNEVVYISGTMADYCDLIVDANEYCSESKNITIKRIMEISKGLHWTIKIDNNKISEIWTHKSPISQDQLKPYSFDEQVDMIPLFDKNRFDYALGYYANE